MILFINKGMFNWKPLIPKLYDQLLYVCGIWIGIKRIPGGSEKGVFTFVEPRDIKGTKGDHHSDFQVRKMIEGWSNESGKQEDALTPMSPRFLVQLGHAWEAVCVDQYEVKLFKAATLCIFFGAFHISELVRTFKLANSFQCCRGTTYWFPKTGFCFISADLKWLGALFCKRTLPGQSPYWICSVMGRCWGRFVLPQGWSTSYTVPILDCNFPRASKSWHCGMEISYPFLLYRYSIHGSSFGIWWESNKELGKLVVS